MIAVTGAGGWVGRGLVERFLAQGNAVRPLYRRCATAHPGRYLDLSDPNWKFNWPVALAGCDVLVHCAAHVHRPIENEEERRTFRIVNTEGTRRLVCAASGVGIKRFVLLSSIAVYGWPRACPPRELEPLSPQTEYGRSKLLCEAFVKASNMDWRIARLATIYGPGDSANFSKLSRAIRRKRFVVPGRGDARKSVLPLAKAIEIITALTSRADCSKVTVNIAAPYAPSLSEICDQLAGAGGCRPPIRIPISLFRACARLGDLLSGVGIGFPLSSDTAMKLTTTSVVDVSQMQFLFPHVKWEGFSETIRASGCYQ